LAVAVLLALLSNTFSPASIPLFGQWDESKGVIRANPKNGKNSLGFEIDSVETAKEMYDKGASIFVDARDRDAFEERHIKGAVLFPISEFDARIDNFLDRYEPDQNIIIYCSGRSCEDSHHLAQLLTEFGYKNVSVMIDGFPGWEKKGFPVE
jgi:rhodanese-related sulfurtransferase